MDRKPWLSRRKMIAAEIYGYSYAKYEDHLGIGNIRYEKLMPEDVDTLERAEREDWDVPRLARALEVPEESVPLYQRSFQEAIAIVDVPTPAESFRRGVRFSIQFALEEGLGDTSSIERLVTQICFRAADLGFRLDMEGGNLSDYSQELRRESEYDHQYWQEKFQLKMQETDQSGENRGN